MIIKKIFIFALCAFALFSCQKEKNVPEQECYPIQSSQASTNLSIKDKKDLLDKNVSIEWSTTDGRGGSFSSVVEQVDTLKNSGVPILVINGKTSGEWHQYASFTDPNQPLITVILNKTDGGGLKVFKLSPVLKGENQVWNGGKSPIGVVENDTEITIYTNSMLSSNGQEAMCMKLTIEK